MSHGRELMCESWEEGHVCQQLFVVLEGVGMVCVLRDDRRRWYEVCFAWCSKALA